MSYPTVKGRAVSGLTYREAQVCLGPKFGGSYYLFFLSGTNTPTNVYTNGALTTPFASLGRVTADAFGRFAAIYLDPSIIYRVQFFNSANVQQWQLDPYVSQLSTVGTSSLSAFGFQISPTGEVTVPAPNTGGSGISLTVKAGTIGSSALRLNGTIPGNSALIINSSATTGGQTAIFTAINKPGVSTQGALTITATAAPSGATYTGGSLTAAFTGVTDSGYTVQLSTGQFISGATFTNGGFAFTTPSTVISGTPNATLIVGRGPTLAATPPVGWLPVTCDGVQYYTPLWYDNNNFAPYTASASANGEVIVAQSVMFGGNGLTTATGGTATPGNWFSPTTGGIGAGYYINITKTSGLSGVAFSSAQGSWVNIGAGGLTISSNAQAAVGGTYQLSTSSGGSPVVANGTITLSGNNGIQSPTYNGATPLVLAGNGTATLNGGGTSNWFAPTTANVGSSYWINITQTGGSSGTTFSAASGAWTNITNGGLTIGLTGGSGTTNATGTYIIASDGAGVNQLGSGTITLTGGSNVQSPNWSGTTPLFLGGDGSATLNGAGTSSWYTPNTANTGSGYYINITRTGGTGGVNFSAAQGSWTNITNSGLTIDLTGFTGDVGTVTATGTWQISSSVTGTPVLGSGSISLSKSGLTVTHQYSFQVGAQTETVPTGATSCTITCEGGGGGGGNSNSPGANAGGGGGGAYCQLTIAVTGGQTMTYNGGGGGNGGVAGSLSPGQAGSAATVSGSVTGGTVAMSAGGGGGGTNAAGGAGGVASGGTTNTNGSAGQFSTTPQGGAGAPPLGGAPDAFNSGNTFPTNTAAGGYGKSNGFAQNGKDGGLTACFTFAYS